MKTPNQNTNYWHHAALYAIAIATLRFFPILLLPFVTAVMSEREYAELEIALSISAILQLACSLSIESAIGRFYSPKNTKHQNLILNTGLTVTLLFSGLLVLATASTHQFHTASDTAMNSDGNTLHRTYSIILISITSTLIGIIMTRIRFSMETILFITVSFIYLVLNFSLILYFIEKQGDKADLYLKGQLISNMIILSLIIFYTNFWSNIVFYITLRWRIVKKLLLYSTPLVPGIFAVWASMNGIRILWMETLNDEMLAYLSAAIRIAIIIKIGEEAIKMIWMPTAIRLKSQSDFADKLGSFASNLILLNCLGGSVLILIAPELVTLLLPVSYSHSLQIIIALVPALLMFAFVQIFLVGPSLHNVTYINSVCLGAGSLVSVGFSFALIETFQTMAIPYSMLAGGFISLLMAVKFNFRIMPLKLDLQLILSSLGFIAIAAIFTALAEFNLQFARLALAIVGLLAIAIISKNLLFSKQHGIVK